MAAPLHAATSTAWEPWMAGLLPPPGATPPRPKPKPRPHPFVWEAARRMRAACRRGKVK